jgi:hypothetical protein
MSRQDSGAREKRISELESEIEKPNEVIGMEDKKVIEPATLYDLLNDCHIAIAKSRLKDKEYQSLSERILIAKKKLFEQFTNRTYGR